MKKSELKRLEELKKWEVITEEEFQLQKKKLMGERDEKLEKIVKVKKIFDFKNMSVNNRIILGIVLFVIAFLLLDVTRSIIHNVEQYFYKRKQDKIVEETVKDLMDEYKLDQYYVREGLVVCQSYEYLTLEKQAAILEKWRKLIEKRKEEKGDEEAYFFDERIKTEEGYYYLVSTDDVKFHGRYDLPGLYKKLGPRAKLLLPFDN